MSWVSTTEAASLCECSERTVYRRVASGQLASRTNENGKLLIEVDGTHRAPGRQLSEVATALTAQLRIATDHHAAMIDTLTAVGVRTERRLAIVEKSARTNARTAILMTVAVVACLTTGGIGFAMLSDTHRDALDAAHDRIDAVQADHRTEIADLTTDHQDVVLTLHRQAARADGARDSLETQVSKSEAERDDLLTQVNKLTAERDKLLTRVNGFAAAARGENLAGVPILLAAQPD